MSDKYQYYKASFPINRTPKQRYTKDYQAFIDSKFYETSDWYTIQEETSFGSGVYQNVDVIVEHAIQSDTGKKRADDFKAIIFKNFNHPRQLGNMYYFDSNFWLCISSDFYKYITASAVLRRCNNALRWIYNGVSYEEPVILDYDYTYDRADYNRVIPLPRGQIKAYCQTNARTNLIKLNEKFIFGNRPQKYNLESINNFISQNTLSNNAPIIDMTFGIDSINTEVDDTTNRIADEGVKYTNIIPPITGSINVIDPQITKILQGAIQSYSVYNYVDNVKSSDGFNVEEVSGMDSVYYAVATTDLNNFTVENKMRNLYDKLTVLCTNLNDSSTTSIDIELKLW